MFIPEPRVSGPGLGCPGTCARFVSLLCPRWGAVPLGAQWRLTVLVFWIRGRGQMEWGQWPRLHGGDDREASGCPPLTLR